MRESVWVGQIEFSARLEANQALRIVAVSLRMDLAFPFGGDEFVNEQDWKTEVAPLLASWLTSGGVQTSAIELGSLNEGDSVQFVAGSIRLDVTWNGDPPELVLHFRKDQ